MTAAATRARALRLALLGALLILAVGSWRMVAERGTPEPDAAPLPVDPRLIVRRDQPYPAADGRSNVYDLYAPADYRQRPYPLLIWLHGGGWRLGDKADWLSRDIAMRAALAGFVVLDANYVLASPEHPAPYPAAPRDIAAFNRWVAAHLADFNATATTRVSIGGHSAGGHLALYQATDADAPFRYACVIDLAGIVDLTTLPRTGTVAPYAQDFAPTEAMRRLASPRFRLADWRADHLLIVHSLRDTIVPVAQAQDLGEALRQIERPPTVEFVLPNRADHDIAKAVSGEAITEFLPRRCR